MFIQGYLDRHCGNGTNDMIMKQTQKKLAWKAYRKQNLQVIFRRSEITKSAVNFKIEDSHLREIWN